MAVLAAAQRLRSTKIGGANRRPAFPLNAGRQFRRTLLASGGRWTLDDMNRLKKTLSLFVIAMGTSLLLSGCVSTGQESDWRWKQYNPEYRPPYPSDSDPFRSGIF